VIALLVLFLQVQNKPALPKDGSTLVKVADAAKVPSLAIDSDGNPYIAFSQNGNIFVSASADGGATFAAPVLALNCQGRDPAVPNRGPHVAVDNAKRVYVSAPVNGDIVFSVSTDKGKTFGRILPVSEPKTGEGAAHGAAAGPGDLHVAWIATREGKPPGLVYCRFGPDGKKPAKQNPVIVTPYPCEQCPPAVFVDGKGNPCVAWRESGHDEKSKANRQIYIAYSSDGGRSFGPAAQLNGVDSGLADCPQEPPALAGAADGKTIAAAWMDRRDLERDANIYWAFGPPGKFARDTDPHDDRRFIQRRPTLAVEPDGTVWCGWEDGRLSSQRVFFTNSKDPANVPLGDAKEGGAAAPCMAAGGGKIAIAYQSGETVGFRVLK
jgi:hypothetical protein